MVRPEAANCYGSVWCRSRILAAAVWALLLRVVSEAQLFAIAFGVVSGRLCASISITCEKAFGLCLLPGRMPRLRAIARWNMSGCVWQGALLSCFDALVGSFFHSRLSVYALAVARFALRPRFRLPIYPDLFGILFGSGRGAWDPPWKLVGIEASRSMPALGRTWI